MSVCPSVIRRRRRDRSRLSRKRSWPFCGLVGHPWLVAGRETTDSGVGAKGSSVDTGLLLLMLVVGFFVRDSALDSSSLSSSLYTVDSADETELRADCAGADDGGGGGGCFGSEPGSGSEFFGFRLGLVRPDGASGIWKSISSRRLSDSEPMDTSDS